MNGERLANLRLLIAGTNNAGAAPIRMFRYLRDARLVQEVSFAGHPLAEEKVRRSELLRWSSAGNKERNWRVWREASMGSFSYLVDCVVTLLFLAAARRRYEIYVGFSPHLGLLGLLLRHLGIVKSTVFWTLDYFPNRFPSRWLNSLYLKLDELCVARSDYAWNITAPMSKARVERGVQISADRMYVVPHPLEEWELEWVALEATEADTILYSGLLKPEYGFDLLLEALPLVIREKPGLKVTITSYQEIPQHLSELLEQKNLRQHFRILGYIADNDEYSRIVQRHRVGVAPYRPTSKGYKPYADPSRVKTYLGRGLPVVITRVPPIAAEIEEKGAGIVVDYEKEQLADAIVKLLSDDEFYRGCRENAIALAQQYRVDRVLSSAFQRMGIKV